MRSEAAVSTLVLERPTDYSVRPGRTPQELTTLLRRLDSWLPAEEQRLTQARAQERPLPRREARWQAMLQLYERLTLALAPARTR
jgi:hypothetical protein